MLIAKQRELGIENKGSFLLFRWELRVRRSSLVVSEDPIKCVFGRIFHRVASPCIGAGDQLVVRQDTQVIGRFYVEKIGHPASGGIRASGALGRTIILLISSYFLSYLAKAATKKYRLTLVQSVSSCEFS